MLQVKAMEYHMNHQSMPIAEEKQMVKHIKKLKDQRPRVRQYEAQYADVEEARAAASNNRGELKELQQERQVQHQAIKLTYLCPLENTTPSEC